MKKIITTISALAIILLFAAIPVVAVYAHGDEEDTQNQTTKKKQYEYSVKTQQPAENVKQQTEQLKEKIEQKRAQIKKDVCQTRKDKIQAKVPRLSNGAVSVKTAFDKVYERVQGFYATGQLTVANYDELKKAVDTAQAQAEAAVQSAKSYKLQIDCEDPNVGNQLAQFREAVKEAKGSLKEYRKTLVALISAMRSAAAEAGDNGENNE